MSIKNTLFCGCSYVDGTGFTLGKSDPALWVNLLHSNNTKLSKTNLINAAAAGRSNAGIFSDAVYQLTKTPFEYAFICWTSVPRYELSLGLETYDTEVKFMPNCPFALDSYNYNDISYSKSYLESVRDRFTSLAHPHYEIVNLLYYVNSLVQLGSLTQTNVFFINSLCPWDQDYFNELTNTLPENYTNYTKKILNINNRDDEEILNIYKKMHKEYSNLGSIHENNWLNLYNSLKSNQIDTNTDETHPGIKSNFNYYKLLDQSLSLK